MCREDNIYNHIMNRDKFKTLIRNILTEEIQKRVPEMTANGLNPTKRTRTFSSDENSRDNKNKNAMMEEITKAVKAVDPDATVVWDDHDDIMINNRDVLFARITPLWEDSFKIVFYPRNEDRFFFTSLTWKQVIEFVKDNIGSKPHYTSVEKARDKVWRNQEDQVKGPDKGLPQKDKPKLKPSTDDPPSKTKNKEKNYTEEQVKNEDDLPEKPMKEVGEDFKHLIDYKVKDPVRLRKRIPDKKLIVKRK